MQQQIHNDIDWVSIQQQDQDLKKWIELVKSGQKPKKGLTSLSPLQRQFEHLKLIDGILYREVLDTNEKTIRQLVLPSAHTKTVLEAMHNEMDHPGRDRTTSLIRDRFYWPGMRNDIDNWIEHCDRCLKRKKEPTKAPLVSITTSQPLELVWFGAFKRRTATHFSNDWPIHQTCSSLSNQKSDC